MNTQAPSEEAKRIRELSDRLVAAQRPIRILDAIKWDANVAQQFFAAEGKKLPEVDDDYYQNKPLGFDPEALKSEFFGIERDIKRYLGQYSDVGNIMQRMCREYRMVIRMLEARGTPDFAMASQELYGSTRDVLYVDGPNINDMASTLGDVLLNLKETLSTDKDIKRHSADEAVKILQKKVNKYFNVHEETVTVKVSDGIVSDASAGADTIKLRQDAMFSDRDIRLLEVHEGWVHIGTTINGNEQPICTFLSKGPPSSTVTQEGLAVIMELFTFSAYPSRLIKIVNRIHAIDMAEKGANFLDVYRFFMERGLDMEEAYYNTHRVFRGSTPTGEPFTKDISYSKGFVTIYNYIRLAIREGIVDRVPLLFLGKTNLEDLAVYEDLIERELVIPPKLLPPQFVDLSSLSAWMSFSLFLNTIDLARLSHEYKSFL